MRTTVENLYKNATYSYSESFSLLAFGFIIGFLFAYDNWGVKGVYNQTLGIHNLLLYTIAALLALFLFTYIQKVIGVLVGVNVSHSISWGFLIFSILLCFVTSGKVIFFIPPMIHTAQKDHLSIGRRPFAFSIRSLRLFALLPILILITLSVFISEVLPLTPEVASAFFWISFLTVLYSLIPIEFVVNFFLATAKDGMAEKFKPHGVSLGSILFYGSKTNLLFAFVFLLCSLISQVTTGFIFTILFCFFVALFATTMYFVNVDIA